MKVPPGTQHDERKKMSNYGVNKLPPNHHNKGNHYVTIKVVVPRKLTKDQERIMKEFSATETVLE